MTIILNSASGTSKTESLPSAIARLLEDRRDEVQLEIANSGQELNEAVSRVASNDKEKVVVAAGGDGTISRVASALVGTEKALGVLPLGTFNHFAKDLGIPMDVEEALRVVEDGEVKLVDVGRVNGRIFLNNSSVGLYPHIVHDRKRQQDHFRRPKWLATLWAIVTVFWRFPTLGLSISANGQTVTRRTPLLFVGNNPYQLEKLQIGTRTGLNSGTLCVFVAHTMGRLGLLWLAMRAVAGHLKAERDFDSFCAADARVHARRTRVSVANDGEMLAMEPPLHYQILPKALRVIVPRSRILSRR